MKTPTSFDQLAVPRLATSLLAANLRVQLLTDLLQDVPLPRTDGDMGEYYTRFLAWYSRVNRTLRLEEKPCSNP